MKLFHYEAGCEIVLHTIGSWRRSGIVNLQGWRKSEGLTVGLSDEESASASNFNMEKAEALMMAQLEEEKKPNEIDQNEINTELGE